VTTTSLTAFWAVVGARFASGWLDISAGAAVSVVAAEPGGAFGVAWLGIWLDCGVAGAV
jgi:hypothetical protein